MGNRVRIIHEPRQGVAGLRTPYAKRGQLLGSIVKGNVAQVPLVDKASNPHQVPVTRIAPTNNPIRLCT